MVGFMLVEVLGAHEIKAPLFLLTGPWSRNRHGAGQLAQIVGLLVASIVLRLQKAPEPGSTALVCQSNVWNPKCKTRVRVLARAT